MALAPRLPDAPADAASEPHITVDEQRIADIIRDLITSSVAAQVGELA